jgi:hypothetical protein
MTFDTAQVETPNFSAISAWEGFMCSYRLSFNIRWSVVNTRCSAALMPSRFVRFLILLPDYKTVWEPCQQLFLAFFTTLLLRCGNSLEYSLRSV